MTSPVQLYLSSSEATNYLNGTYKSDMMFLFKSPVVPPPTHYMSLRLVNMYVPISFTLINDTNNELKFNGTSYYVENGNYTATELATSLMDLVATDDATFSVVFSSNTNKYTFSSAINDFTLDGTILSILGFSETSTSTSYELVATYPVDLTGENTLYLDVRNLTTFNIASSTASRTSIVASVLVSVPYGNVLYYQDTIGTAFTLQEDQVSFLHIRLLGEDQTIPVNMNNFNFSCTLEIGFVPKSIQPTIPQNFKDVYTNYIRSLT